MIWLKYRHNFSYGTHEYEWMDVSDLVEVGQTKDDLSKEYLEHYVIDELKCEYDYSDKYRGIDYELFDAPPLEIIKEDLDYIQSSIKSKQETAKIYAEYIKENS